MDYKEEVDLDYGYKPTTTGRAILAACLATQKPLVLTRVAVGCGTVPEGTNLADVHELVSYVADGALGERRHEADRLYLTIQYENSANPGIGTFFLSEFIVYAQDPETGEEKDLLYATLGDYKQPVPAYSQDMPPSVWKFPMTLIVSDEIEVKTTGAAGLVTYDDLQKAVNKACRNLLNSIARGGIKKTILFSIPVASWVDNSEAADGYGFYYDLMDADVTDDLIPDVTISEQSLEIAKQASMCPTATTYAGYVRFKCVDKPTGDIEATCNLLGRGAMDGEAIESVYVLPPADNTTLGGVIIQEGSGLKIDDEGHLSVDFASDEETKDAIEDVLGDTTTEDGSGGTSGGNDVATDEEVKDTVEDVFGESSGANVNLNGYSVASPEDVEAMIDDIFGSEP